MSRNRLLGFVLLVLTVAARGGPAADSDPVLADPARGFVANQILIKLKTGVPGERAVDAIGAVAGHELRAFPRIGVHQWQLGRGVSVERALEILSGPAFAKTVEYAEPNYLLYASDLPDPDPRFGDLYGLNNVGQTGGTPDADIDAP